MRASDHLSGRSSALAAETFGIVVVFAVVVFAVDPRGDIPLNDDWNFALATWWFADHGEFRFARFTGMSLRAQVVWGAAWTLLLGKSFEVLRWSTLTLSLLTLLLFHRLCARAGAERFTRLLATGSLLAFPIFLWSSFTYMTQVPFLFASVLAIYCWLRACEHVSGAWFAVGLAAVVVSVFIRQSGITSLAPACLALLYMWPRMVPRRRYALATSTAAVGILFVVLLAGTDWLSGRPEEFAIRFGLLEQGPVRAVTNLTGQAISNSAFVLVYAVLGLGAVTLPGIWRPGTSRQILALLLVALPLTWGLSTVTALWGPVPLQRHGNVIAGWSFGPHTLRDAWVLGLDPPGSMAPLFRWLLTAAGGIVMPFIIVRLWLILAKYRMRNWSSIHLAVGFGVAYIAGALAILATTDIIFDRYALDAAWPLALIVPLSIEWSPPRKYLSALLLCLLLTYSTRGVADYLAWNRARWQAWELAMQRGVTMDQFDGGYEINQYLVGGFDGPMLLRKFQFSVVDDQWILAFQRVRGYSVVESVHYSRWSGRGVIHLLVRNDTTAPRTSR